MIPKKIDDWLRDYMPDCCVCSDCGTPVVGKRNSDGSIFCASCEKKRDRILIKTLLAAIGVFFFIAIVIAAGIVLMLRYTSY